MRHQLLENNDYALLKKLVCSTQTELHTALSTYLKKKYPNKTIITKDYIVAIGDIPIALVAHMDTVFKAPPTDNQVFFDRERQVIWSSAGLGSDDRAGIFAILQILKVGFRPSIILTVDEELGGLGASALSEEKCPIDNLKYMIELDRRGANDCVFYDCYNKDFEKYIQNFGFIKKQGTFSDISFLMPAWNICGVNLSVGYEHEHSYSEILYCDYLYDTIAKVCKMLEDTNIPDFKYDELIVFHHMIKDKTKAQYGHYDEYSFDCRCYKCHKIFSEYEIFPVKTSNGATRFYCPDCIAGNIDWCAVCGEPYEIIDPTQQNICYNCYNGEGKNV